MSPALSEFVTTAHSPATDPHLHVWGWEIPVYLFLGGFTAGIMVLSGWALWRGPAEPALAPDLLPRLERPLHAGARHDLPRHAGPLPRPRPQAVRLAAVPDDEALVADVLGLLDPAPRLPRARRRRAPRTRRECSLRCLPAIGPLSQRLADDPRAPGARSASSRWRPAIGLGIYTGILLSALGARPLWSSGLLGPLFLASGPLVERGLRPLGLARAGGAAADGLARQPVPRDRARPDRPAPDRPRCPRPRRTPRPRGWSSAGPTRPSSGSASWGSASSCPSSSSRSPSPTASSTRRSRRSS